MFSRFSAIKAIGLSVFAICLLASQGLAQQSGGVRGTITDPAGAVIAVALVGTIDTAGKAGKIVVSNSEGVFNITELAADKYLIRVTAPGFDPFEKKDVVVAAGRVTTLDITLGVTISEQVTVGDSASVNIEPDANASATVLKGDDIAALPDDPAELEAALQALAGPGAGPGGGEIFIDGFSGGRLPRLDTIREIRINQNPFSSEYDRLGLGRIEILTKPGTEDWNGEAEFEFEDESLNSRNPFAPNRPPFQQRAGAFELSGPIIKDKVSFSSDVELERQDNNSLVNALVLDSSLNPVPFQRSVRVPTRGFEFRTRIDAQLGEKHTFTSRYSMSRDSVENTGLGGFDLPTRAFSRESHDDTFRFTDAWLVSPTIVNETRFQYVKRGNSRSGGELTPTLRVLDAFTSGGANVGDAFFDENRFELQNYTSIVRDKHSFKTGIRLRHNRQVDSSPGNFAGTFTFTSLDQYRNTILNLPGAFPTQFSIAGGDPQAKVTRTDVGLFFQDDWRFSPKLTLSFGLRYENQTNISSNGNIAPRFGFAYALDGGGQTGPKTVIRGGFGVFYDRFGENLTLQTARFNGINQQQFIVTDPAILDAIVFTTSSVSGVPTADQLAAFAQRQTTRVVSPGLSSPYTLQTVFSIERQLPHNSTVSATFTNVKTRRLFRTTNINAPINGVRPNPTAGNILQYESTGRFDQTQMIVNFRSRFAESVSIFGNYSIGKASSDTDGAGSLPANSYDFSGEYGDASVDTRHRFTVGGNFDAPWGLRVNPFITFRTGTPFNITTGADDNGDSIFNDRPAFALNSSEPGVVVSRFGVFDPTPEPGDTIIPRNFGRGFNFFNVNLNISKEFGFGGSEAGGDDEDDDESRYTIELSTQIRNLFNRTNAGTPVGNLRSQFFGLPVSLAGGGQAAGNRRIQFEIEFSF